MMPENLILVEPSHLYRQLMLEMAEDYERLGTPDERAMFHEATVNFDRYLRRLAEMAAGVNLSPGLVAQSTYWLIRQDGPGSRPQPTLVATSRLRHDLTPYFEYELGHIGYGTRPSERCKGYGKVICRLTLDKARQLGMRRVLLTCDADNEGSARIIVANGGRLESQVVSRLTGTLKNRYWIELTEAKAA